MATLAMRGIKALLFLFFFGDSDNRKIAKQEQTEPKSVLIARLLALSTNRKNNNNSEKCILPQQVRLCSINQCALCEKNIQE